MKKVIRSFIIYVSVVIVSAVIYRVYWEFNIDSFTITNNFNLQPFSDKSVVKLTSLDFTEIQHDLNVMRLQADSLGKAYIQDSLESEYIGSERKQIHDLLYCLVDEAIDSFEVSFMSDSELEVSKLKQLKEHLLGYERDTLAAVYLQIEILKAELNAGRKRIVMYDSIINFYHTFRDPGLVFRYNKIDSTMEAHSDILDGLQDSSFFYKKSIREKEDRYRIAVKARLGITEFLYFSAATASGLSYGDISPNGTCIRFIVIFQSMVCVIAFARIISYFSQ